MKEKLLEKMDQEGFEPVELPSGVPEAWQEPALSFQECGFPVLGESLLPELLRLDNRQLKYHCYRGNKNRIKIEYGAFFEFHFHLLAPPLQKKEGEGMSVYRREVYWTPNEDTEVSFRYTLNFSPANNSFTYSFMRRPCLTGFEISVGLMSGNFTYHDTGADELITSELSLTDQQKRFLLRRI